MMHGLNSKAEVDVQVSRQHLGAEEEMRTKKRTKVNLFQEEKVMAVVKVMALLVVAVEKVMTEKTLLVVVVAGEDQGGGRAWEVLLALSLLVPRFNMSRLTFMRWGLPRQIFPESVWEAKVLVYISKERGFGGLALSPHVLLGLPRHNPRVAPADLLAPQIRLCVGSIHFDG